MVASLRKGGREHTVSIRAPGASRSAWSKTHPSCSGQTTKWLDSQQQAPMRMGSTAKFSQPANAAVNRPPPTISAAGFKCHPERVPQPQAVGHGSARRAICPGNCSRGGAGSFLRYMRRGQSPCERLPVLNRAIPSGFCLPGVLPRSHNSRRLHPRLIWERPFGTAMPTAPLSACPDYSYTQGASRSRRSLVGPHGRSPFLLRLRGFARTPEPGISERKGAKTRCRKGNGMSISPPPQLVTLTKSKSGKAVWTRAKTSRDWGRPGSGAGHCRVECGLFRFEVQTALPGNGTTACACYIDAACTGKWKSPNTIITYGEAWGTP